MDIKTTGTVLRSQAPNRKGEPSGGAFAREAYAVHAGEQGWIALDSRDAELALLLGFKVAAIEEDPKPPTTQDRYAAAVKAIRKSGVAIRQNVSACCRGCAEPFKTTKGFDAETTPYAWNFGGQGGAIRWSGNGEYTYLPSDTYRYGRSGNPSTQKVYFNHGNGSAERIVAAFKAEGFEVEWDGEQRSCVEVTVPARAKSRYER